MKHLSIKILIAALMTSGTAQAESCLFGGDISDLAQENRLSVTKNVITTFKLSRIDETRPLIMVAIDIVKDRQSKRVFQVNRTFRHIDDGDNTIGWIEEVTGAASADGGAINEGNIVAIISDSFIDSCLVNK